MIPLPDPAGQTDRERGYEMRQYTAQQMLDYASSCLVHAAGNLPSLPKPWGHYPKHLQVACYTSSCMKEYGALCVLNATGPTLDHVDAAREVLTLLGYAISPSREAGADDRVDRVAGVLARCLQPNVAINLPP